MALSGQLAPGFLLCDHTGEARSLASLLGPSGLALIFYRGYWWPFCLHQLVDFNRYASDFVRAGYHLAALAVDPLHRSAKLHLQLDLAFPLLCDPRREVVRAWDLYNPRERGGIAVPATVLLDNHAHIRFLAREAMASRLRASDLLAYASGGRTTAPVPHGFWPRTRDWWRALFH